MARARSVADTSLIFVPTANLGPTQNAGYASPAGHMSGSPTASHQGRLQPPLLPTPGPAGEPRPSRDSGWTPCFSQLRAHGLGCSHFTGLHLFLTVRPVFPSEGFGRHMAGNARLYVPASERLHALIQLNSGRRRSQDTVTASRDVPQDAAIKCPRNATTSAVRRLGL